MPRHSRSTSKFCCRLGCTPSRSMSMAADRTPFRSRCLRDVMEQRLAHVDENQKALSDAIDALVTGLRRQQDEAKTVPSLPSCPSLDALSSMFGLSTFERAIVLLCTGLEL